ncbi:hypothetical protein [Pseudonocardia sp. TRM90224]|uniref:hypothetical protein n=1 Tax=Pseudonocardia sp. TRM90224 TaxID=2812678 RepID=UPI001E5ED50D|nr:hypothetical protein [Pseudonocardia sp. TRM90224]
MRRAQSLLAVLAVGIAVLVGFVAAATVPTPPPGQPTVEAELLAPSPAPELATVGAVVPTPARWIAADGRLRTAQVWAEAGLAEGDTITLVVDGSGRPLTPQPRYDDPTIVGLIAACATALTCWAMLAFMVAVWRRRLDALDDEQWESGWAAIEPQWSGRS